MGGAATGLAVLGWALFALAVLGSGYMIAATLVFRRFLARQPAPARRRDAVTLLKPLHGAEIDLAANLASFLDQDHDGPIQLLCGVADPADPAIAAVEALRRARPAARIDLVVDATPHGANGKIANLVNLAPHIAHDIVILSDSDIAVPRSYLPQLLAALDMAGVGAASCLYYGRGTGRFWARIGAAGPSYQFLPGLVFGYVNRLAEPCMGSTIALRRATLERIGGFARFADVLADDHAIGQAIGALGLKVVVPPMLVAHASGETSFAAVWRHDVRWGVTIRAVAPAGHAGSVIGLPLPIALLAALLVPPPAGVGIVLLSFATRIAAARTIDARAGEVSMPWWLLPVRDCLSLAVFVATYFARSVDWRGQRLRMQHGGRISAGPEFPS